MHILIKAAKQINARPGGTREIRRTRRQRNARSATSPYRFRGYETFLALFDAGAERTVAQDCVVPSLLSLGGGEIENKRGNGSFRFNFARQKAGACVPRAARVTSRVNSA